MPVRRYEAWALRCHVRHASLPTKATSGAVFKKGLGERGGKGKSTAVGTGVGSGRRANHQTATAIVARTSAAAPARQWRGACARANPDCGAGGAAMVIRF